jgi:RNA polymerase sigma factor (sigma-70 family)
LLVCPFFLYLQPVNPEVLQQIIRGCIREDAREQRHLFERFAKPMLSICLRYAGDRMEAEDVLQMGFVKVFKSISTFQGGSFEGWMKRIFIRESINQYHSRRRKPLDFVDDHTPALLNYSDGFTEVLSSLSSAEILKMLSEISEGSRIVFQLFAIEGYSHAEIAEMLGISIGTSKSQYSRARHLMKQQLQHYHYETGR